ncbi:hypothetical protein ACWT_2043 [Actinoplanes sp. SE50]|uniref:hypothetical protein n=1 Tax=unclassified Actinoplanes TaxID=2626549 RepID=UPI00023EC5AD|nr:MULTISPECIES: hypothetical protein [unclassified Actinoplanes]AEV83062.1 hypothetical protein ACPL_2165 [Actinoplanes sp. SE50/110]ATO81458.1 hypothetical protein ACWT_2043 [Actinoplanes sp. SE50]SLL98865.1 hypothetical protein ACSP50_2092 [Actinoplanes sp. SE50/110]
MARVSTAATAASSQVNGPDGSRAPAGEVHAWLPGTNQTLCGLALSRTRLVRFPHQRFDYRASDVTGAGDDIGFICPKCVAATTPRDQRDGRGWKRVAPRP